MLLLYFNFLCVDFSILCLTFGSSKLVAATLRFTSKTGGNLDHVEEK